MVTCVLMKCLAAAISSTVTTQGWDSSLLVDRTFATWLHAMKTLYYQSITNVHKYFLRYRGGVQDFLSCCIMYSGIAWHSLNFDRKCSTAVCCYVQRIVLCAVSLKIVISKIPFSKQKTYNVANHYLHLNI